MKGVINCINDANVKTAFGVGGSKHRKKTPKQRQDRSLWELFKYEVSSKKKEGIRKNNNFRLPPQKKERLEKKCPKIYGPNIYMIHIWFQWCFEHDFCRNLHPSFAPMAHQLQKVGSPAVEPTEPRILHLRKNPCEEPLRHRNPLLSGFLLLKSFLAVQEFGHLTSYVHLKYMKGTKITRFKTHLSHLFFPILVFGF